jgi:cholesterol transport system auxiliary component
MNMVLKLTRSRLLSASLLLMLLLLLLSCSMPGKQQKIPVKTYTLSWMPAAQASSSLSMVHCAAVLLNTPRAAPGFTSSRMAYIREAHRLDYFAYHEWVDSPAHMLAPLLRQALENSGLFQAVIMHPVSTVQHDVQLNFELLHLQQQFQEHSSEVQLGLRVDLYDMKLKRLIASRVISLNEAGIQNTPYAGVVASNHLVSRLMEELIAILDAALADAPGICAAQ